MNLLPTSKRDWLLIAVIAPSVVWLPIAILLLVGIQGATPRDPSTAMIVGVVVTVTALLLTLAVIGIRRIGVGERMK